MKISFSLLPKSKASTSDRNEAADKHNLKDCFTDPSDDKPSYVIPPLEDRWRAHKETNIINLPLPFASALEFESDKIRHGLDLRQKVEDVAAASKPAPLEQMLLKSLRNDMKSLPDAPELEDFESFPVEGFGDALLAGYGWKPGQGIGLKAKEDIPIVEYRKWSGNEGLGFNPDTARVKGQTIETREKALWLRSHIRVQIISKHVKGGRLYLKKAVVTDVVGPTTCDITMDETQELVQGIDQELLETALPMRGGPVLVLSGGHKGVYGSLVEKDLDKETGVVCDADSKEMIDVKLEQVAEYIGDPGDIGY